MTEIWEGNQQEKNTETKKQLGKLRRLFHKEFTIDPIWLFPPLLLVRKGLDAISKRMTRRG